jgi:hypothetical protein
MLLTWHIVQKDLRRLRPWLALLVAAILARYAHFHIPAYAPELNEIRALWNRAELIDGILLGLALFATALTAATLVHEDAVIGDRPFWLTRPVSGARLLAAKTLTFTLTIILLPLALQLGWWLLNRYSLADIAAQFPILFARQAGTAFAAFVFALLTRNLGSFILTTIIGALAVIATHVLVNEWLKFPARTDDYNRERIELIFALLALPACITHQYLTRHTRRTLVLFGGTLLLALGIHAAWTWPLFKKPSRVGALPILASASATTASAGAPESAYHTRRNWSSGGAKPQFEKIPVFAFSLTLDLIPADHFVQILDARFPKDTPLTLNYQNRLTLPRITFPENYTDTTRLLLFHRGGNTAPEISTPVENTLTLALRQPVKFPAIPLSIGSTVSLGPRHLRVIDIRNLNSEKAVTRTFPDGSKVTTRTTYTAQKFALVLEETLPPHLLATDARFAEADNDSFSYYSTEPNEPTLHLGEGHSRHAWFLVSRRDGTTTRADNILVHGSDSVDGVRRRLIRAEFPIRLRETDLADYDLVKVVAPLVGTFTRTITLPATHWTEPASPESR